MTSLNFNFYSYNYIKKGACSCIYAKQDNSLSAAYNHSAFFNRTSLINIESKDFHNYMIIFLLGYRHYIYSTSMSHDFLQDAPINSTFILKLPGQFFLVWCVLNTKISYKNIFGNEFTLKRISDTRLYTCTCNYFLYCNEYNVCNWNKRIWRALSSKRLV